MCAIKDGNKVKTDEKINGEVPELLDSALEQAKEAMDKLNLSDAARKFLSAPQAVSTMKRDLDTVNECLENKMTKAFHDVHDKAVDRGVNTRLPAFMVAIQRINTAMELRGRDDKLLASPFPKNSHLSVKGLRLLGSS